MILHTLTEKTTIAEALISEYMNNKRVISTTEGGHSDYTNKINVEKLLEGTRVNTSLKPTKAEELDFIDYSTATFGNYFILKKNTANIELLGALLEKISKISDINSPEYLNLKFQVVDCVD